MEVEKLKTYDDDALTALLFGVVIDCLAACGETECPLRDLPNGSLSALFDALLALPRYDKLELLVLPDCCADRHAITVAHLRGGGKGPSRLVDTTHLTRTRRSDSRR